ncbi:hypothetical protein RYH73_06620 [Olivibacter sp. CPCC 100613]|uniref:carboxypeptidase regulatory-like domain-containing protein n=1 Tax=Olivibacter sp. CPCC 100613 TaxID=3079931 RepID=UPI002FF82349
MKFMVSFLATFAMLASQAQELKINGQLKTATGKKIPYANILLKNRQRGIVTYTTSSIDGNFSLTLADTTRTTYWLEINHIGYKKTIVSILSDKMDYSITMEEQPIDLAEVEVKSPPISSNNDTLRYDVESFSKSTDRTIADVLKRMPGVEVEEGGQIKYNGKNISNFYIDGDDLLNDRYNIGTKTIPQDMVKDVEILQNHQPIEVLRNKSYSDEVAINLKVKEEAKLKLMGQVKASGGTPSLYEAELNSILFNNKHKMLHVAKVNNVGIDFEKELTAFNADNQLQSVNNQRPSELLSSGTVSKPNIPTERYNFNHSALLSANNLTKLKNGFQLTANMSLLYDRNEMNYNNWTDMYVNRDTIHYSESQKIGNKPFMTAISLNLKNNNKKYYFNNMLQINLSGEESRSDLKSNSFDFSQRLKTKQYDFSNKVSYIPSLKNQHILDINWYLNHYNAPQSLTISPGINEEILNDSVPFQSINQVTHLPTWFSNLSVGYRIPKGLIKQHYLVGFVSEWQHLASNLELMQASGEQVSYENSADNDLFWQRYRININPSFEYNKGSWESVLSLPLAMQKINYEDAGFTLKENFNKWLFNPTWNIIYNINSEDYLTATYNYNNQIGTISDLYRGAILTNYRSIQSNNTKLQEKNLHNIGLRYNYQRSLNMFFLNASINYSKISSNTILSRIITDNLFQTVLLPFNNKSHSLTVAAGISKYLFDIDVNVGAKISWDNIRYNQFLNNQSLPFNNISFNFNPYFETHLFNFLFLKYDGKGSWTTSKMVNPELDATIPERQMQFIDQSVTLTLQPFENTFFKLHGRQLLTVQEQAENVNYFFTDLNIRYKIDQWKADIELEANNLTNIKSYELYTLSSNQVGYSQYDLRGRTLLLRLSFRI